MSPVFLVEAEQGALIDSARFIIDDGLSAARMLASSVDEGSGSSSRGRWRMAQLMGRHSG